MYIISLFESAPDAIRLSRGKQSAHLTLFDTRSYNARVLRYAISDSKRFGSTLEERRLGVVRQAARCAAEGVDYLQLREKDLQAGDLLTFAEVIASVRKRGEHRVNVLINSRADVAVAAGADGVHMTSRPDELTPAQVRFVYSASGCVNPIISMSCHTLDDVQRAREGKADLILFGPVFEKRVDDHVVSEGCGLSLLHQAVGLAQGIPVLALGGVTAANTQACMDVGSAGIAAIRLFQ